MRRFLLASSLLLATTAAQAQTATPANYVIGAGGSTNVTLSGTAGAQFAVIASSTNSGFSYAGVNLFVGTDVQILTVGVLDGAGQATVPVTPPFPARDRIYMQAVFSQNGFASIVPSNGFILVNNQVGSLFMPLGGIVTANGTFAFFSPGMTVSKAGSVYTITHTGLIPIPSAIPSVTPTTAGVTVANLQSNANQTVVTLSADSAFFFTIQPVRR
jgi:hypothetical protein